MWNWHRDEIMVRERLGDLERTIIQQQLIDAVTTGQRRSATGHTLLIYGSRLLISTGHRLEQWGQRLQHAPHAGSVDY